MPYKVSCREKKMSLQIRNAKLRISLSLVGSAMLLCKRPKICISMVISLWRPPVL